MPIRVLDFLSLALAPCLTLVARAQVIRKERAVGVVPQVPTVYEVLEELAITVQHQMIDTRIPFCAFNGAPRPGAPRRMPGRLAGAWLMHFLWPTRQHSMRQSSGFCQQPGPCLAGGNDVFVDVGNKSFGLEALMKYLGFQPSGVLHVGDRCVGEFWGQMTAPVAPHWCTACSPRFAPDAPAACCAPAYQHAEVCCMHVP